MPGRFLDSSALVKLYHQESGSSVVEECILRSGEPVLISRLAVVEIQSALSGKVRTGAISAVEAEMLRRRFLADIANQQIGVAAISSEHFDQAAALVRRHGVSYGLRTLDALQLAVMLTLRKARFAEILVAADKTLCRAAAAEGVPVLDPEAAL